MCVVVLEFYFYSYEDYKKKILIQMIEVVVSNVGDPIVSSQSSVTDGKNLFHRMFSKDERATDEKFRIKAKV